MVLKDYRKNFEERPYSNPQVTWPYSHAGKNPLKKKPEEESNPVAAVSKHRVPVFDGLPLDWSPEEAVKRLADELDICYFTSGTSSSEKIRCLIIVYGLMITDLLLTKNKRYGNSATDPVSVFARDVSTRDRLRVRMDDKVSRLMRGGDFGDKEDPRVDLTGYLLLDLILDYLEKN